jgi:hypothetical protein
MLLCLLISSASPYQALVAGTRSANHVDADLGLLVRANAAGGSILALSSYLGTGFPLVNETKVGWASRYPMFWQIPGFYATQGWPPEQYRTRNEMSPTEQRFVESVVEDLEGRRPSLVVVDDIPPTPAMAGFDFLKYFLEDPKFARLFANYQFLARTRRYRIFQSVLLARKHVGDPAQ